MHRLLLVIVVGCGSKEDAKPAAPPPPRAADAAAPDAFAVWPATLEDRVVALTWHDHETTLTGRVPAGWTSRSQGSFSPPTTRGRTIRTWSTSSGT